ncbi:MAG: hypothetical protein JNK82_25085, partial [Myxococcaceae bacterium]|nr:hypothetical protein [Myxococcaceae bacterium]
ELPLTGPATVATTEAPNDINQQYRVTIPGEWIVSGVSITVRVDPNNVFGETDKSNNDVIVTPTVGRASVLAVTHVPIVANARTGTPRNINTAMTQIWPLKGVDATTRAAYTYTGTLGSNGTGWSNLLEQLYLTRQTDMSRRNYLGWLNFGGGGGGGVLGLGFVGIGAALSRDGMSSGVGTAVHELGHNMGREHSPCGGAQNADPQYPVANARLDTQGWDYVSNRVIQPTQAHDVMAYCDPQWVSNYVYTRVQQFLEARPASASLGPGLVASPYIAVSGRISGDDVSISPATLIVSSEKPELEGAANYTLTLYGEKTFSVPFATARVADFDEQHFAVLAPAVNGLFAIEVSRGGQVLARRLAGPQRPPQTAAVKKVTGGVEVEWDASAFPYAALAHFGEGGRTTLALQLEGGRAFVSTEGLTGAGDFEVSLSDGVQSQRLMVGISR